jgi:hypothetical protein
VSLEIFFEATDGTIFMVPKAEKIRRLNPKVLLIPVAG